MKRYAKDQDEMAAMLGISARQFRTYSSRPDAPVKTKSGYNIAQWTEYYRRTKAEGLKGDGSLKDEKLLREIERLDVQIGQMSGTLVDAKETEAAYRRKLQRYRGIADSWKSHESAKSPEIADRIAELHESLCKAFAEDADAQD